MKTDQIRMNIHGYEYWYLSFVGSELEFRQYIPDINIYIAYPQYILNFDCVNSDIDDC